MAKGLARYAMLASFSVVAGLMLFYPAEGLQAALRGVKIWWDILFPSLFPFFVISELLLGFGIVHFFGKLFDPIMRPVFRVPGIGGFAMAMGFASGYPVGARLTSRLWEQRLVNREEGERLVSFTSTSDPIFLIGAVSVGFFGRPELAPVLLLAHYGGGLITGVLMRFHGGGRQSQKEAAHEGETREPLLKRAFQAMHEARLEDGRPFGLLLKDATQNSIRLILVVGGLVVFFSALMELMSLVHLLAYLRAGVGWPLGLLHIPGQMADAIVNGLFEVTLGAKTSAVGADIPLIHQAAAAAFVLSWSGLSVHAQIVSLLTETNIRYWPFLLARIVHAFLGMALVYAVWPFLGPQTRPALAWISPFLGSNGAVRGILSEMSVWTWVLLMLLLLGFLIPGARKIAGR